MKELSPHPRTEIEPEDDDDAIWHEALSALGLLGAVLLIVVVMSIVGRL